MPACGEIDLSNFNQLSELAKEEFLARQTQLNHYWDYYKRQHKKWLLDPETKKPAPENVTINLARRVVNQTTAFLFGKTPIISAGDDSMREVINELLDANNEDSFFPRLGKVGAITGHCFVKIVPEGKGVRWVLLDPRHVSVYWAGDDVSRAVAYKIEWVSGKVSYRQDVIYQPKIGAWLMRDLVKEENGEWKPRADVAYNWEFAFAPIVDWQNLSDPSGYYGESDLIALDLNDAVNFTSSNVNSILKYHASPRTVATGVSPEEIKETSVNGLWATENENAKISNLEMTSDLSSSMAFLEFERDSFYSESQAVDLSKLKDKANDLTNFALRVIFNDALEKNSTKQMEYGRGLKDLIYRSLIVIGKSVKAKDISVTFEDPLPKNRQEIAQIAQMGVEGGWMSRETASTETGHEWSLEQKRMQAEKSEENLDLGSALMGLINQDGQE